MQMFYQHKKTKKDVPAGGNDAAAAKSEQEQPAMEAFSGGEDGERIWGFFGQISGGYPEGLNLGAEGVNIGPFFTPSLEKDRTLGGGEEVQGRSIDRSVGGYDNVGWKRKRGRPLGSKNRKKCLHNEEVQRQSGEALLIEGGTIQSSSGKVAGGNGAKDEVVGWKKGRRGRPKGSKNKKKSLVVEENGGLSAEVAGSNSIAVRKKGTIKVDYVPFRINNDHGDRDVSQKRKRGRPKGSKNRKKILVVEENVGVSAEVAGSNSIAVEKKGTTKDDYVPFRINDDDGDGDVSEKCRCGRPKGSLNRKTSAIDANKGSEIGSGNDGGHENASCQVSKNGTQILEAKEDQSNVLILHKYDGIPESEGQIVVVNEDQSHYSEFAYGNHGEDDNVPHGLKDEKPIFAAKQDQSRLSEAAGKNADGYENLVRKQKRGRPKGSKKKPRLIIAGEVLSYSNKEVKNLVMTKNGGELLAESRSVQQRRRGRPRKNADGRCKSLCFREEYYTKKLKANGNAKIGGELLAESSGVQHRRRGRPRKNADEHCKSICIREEYYTKKLKANGNAKNGGELLAESSGVQQRHRGRPRKNADEHCKSLCIREEYYTKKLKANGNANSGSSAATHWKKEQWSLMCHQCLKNDKRGIVFCSNCKINHYCHECIMKWYPGATKEELEKACPFCRGICNCKMCLQVDVVVKANHTEADENVRLQRLLYLLHKTLPLLRQIQGEQNLELDVEATIHGIQLTEEDITKSILDDNDRVYWYNNMLCIVCP